MKKTRTWGFSLLIGEQPVQQLFSQLFQRLMVLLILASVGLLLFSGANDYWRTFYSALAFGSLGVIVLILLRFGFITGGVSLFLVGFTILDLHSVITGHGLRDTALFLFPLMLVYSSLLLGQNIFRLYSVVLIGTLAGVGFLQVLGYFDNIGLVKHKIDPDDVIIIVAILGMTAYSLDRLVSRLTQTLIRVRDTEQDYREIFNSTNESILVQDPESGEIIDVNQPTIDMFGFSQKEMEKLAFSDILLPEYGFDMDRAAEKLKKARTEGPQLFEWLLRRKNGTLFWSEVTLRMSTIGGEERILAVIRDIQEQKEKEQAQHRAEKLKALGQMAGGIAHEFNNQLNLIIGYGDLLRRKKVSEEERTTYINEMFEAGKRSQELVQRILTFSRDQPDKMDRVDLSHLTEDVVKMLKTFLPAGVRLRADIHPGLFVLGNKTQLHEVILNLSNNAVDAINGQGEIEIELRKVELSSPKKGNLGKVAPGEYHCLMVRDTGAGMAMSQLDKIFDPFYTTKDPDKGTGLGLSVVHGILKSHKASILVDSTPGQGTCFTVYFPVA